MPSFYIPLTGLNADSTALNTIANDLANMNTTGFKAQTVNFADLFYQQIGTAGSGDPIQAGAGTQVANTESDFSAGTSNSTGLATDVALQGNGFFVVNHGSDQYLTRNGDFSLDSNGNLITSDGFSVMGYPAVNGKINTSSPLVAINIPENETMAPHATTNFSLNGTLDSNAKVGDSFPGSITVYDSLGNPYLATVTFTKAATNQWNYSVSLPDKLQPVVDTATNTTTFNFGQSGGVYGTVDSSTNLTITAPNGATPPVMATITAPTITPGEDIGTYAGALQAALTAAGITGVTVTGTGGQLSISGANVSVSGNVVQDPVAANATGTLNFDANGNLVSPSSNVTGISFAGLSDGAANLNVTWDLFGSNGAGSISQVAQTSAVSPTSQDGYAAGNYTGFTVNSDGTVLASFDNGQKLTAGQLALGTVANLQGLQALGNSEYAATTASGQIAVGVSGSAGLGTMQDGALEASNVNISAEFSDLIIAQRAFEANSKAITTFDTVTQETIQMIH